MGRRKTRYVSRRVGRQSAASTAGGLLGSAWNQFTGAVTSGLGAAADVVGKTVGVGLQAHAGLEQAVGGTVGGAMQWTGGRVQEFGEAAKGVPGADVIAVGGGMMRGAGEVTTGLSRFQADIERGVGGVLTGAPPSMSSVDRGATPGPGGAIVGPTMDVTAVKAGVPYTKQEILTGLGDPTKAPKPVQDITSSRGYGQWWWDRYAGYEDMLKPTKAGGIDTRDADMAIAKAMRRAESEANPLRTKIEALGFPKYYGGGGASGAGPDVKVGGVSEDEAAAFQGISGKYIVPSYDQMLSAGVPLARVRETLGRDIGKSSFEIPYDSSVAKYAASVVVPSASHRARARRKAQRVRTGHLVTKRENVANTIRNIHPPWKAPQIENIEMQHGITIRAIDVPYTHSKIHPGLASRAKAQHVHTKHIVPDTKIRKVLTSMSVKESTGHHVYVKKGKVDVANIGVTRGNLKLDILGGFKTQRLPKIDVEGMSIKRKKK